VADQVDDPVKEHPPEVGVLALVEQFLPGPEANLAAARRQLRKLLVSQAAEQINRT
jgi:hypothetical protein